MADPVSNLTLSDLVTGAATPPPKVKVSDIRAKYPMYSDLSDDQLLTAIHQKIYPEMSARQFYGGLDYDTDRAKLDPTKDMGAIDTFRAGAGKALADTWGGVKRIGNMVGIGDYDQQAAQQDAKTDEPLMNTTAGKLGNFAGNVALTAIPVGAATGAVARGVTTGARYLPGAIAATTRVLAPTIAAATTGAATGAIQNPADMQRGAEMGAAGGAGGDLLGRGLTRAAGGVIANGVTPEARTLMDQGVNVPFWQAQQSQLIRGLGERAKALPIVGDVMRNAEARAGQQWNRIVQNGANPATPVMDEAGNILRWETTPIAAQGQEGMQQLGQKFRDAYGAIYNNRVLPVGQGTHDAINDIVNQTAAYNPSIAADVAGAARQATDTLGVGVAPTVNTVTRGGAPVGSGRISSTLRTPQTSTTTTTLNHEGATGQQFQDALGQLDQRINAAWQNGQADTAQALQGIRDAVDQGRFSALPPEVQAQLAPTNAAYANFKTLQKAASTIGAARNDGVVSPGQLVNAIRARDMTPGKSAFAQGTAPGQQAAQDAQKVFGSRLPEVGPGTAEKLMLVAGGGLGWMAPTAAIGGLLLTAPGQRLLQGGYGFQQWARSHPDALANALRTTAVSAADTK